MVKYLIKDTTREERERIVAESLGNIDASCDGCSSGIVEMYQNQKHRQYYRKNLTFLHSFYLLFDFDSFLCLSESILSDFSVNFHRFLLDLVEIFLDFF